MRNRARTRWHPSNPAPRRVAVFTAGVAQPRPDGPWVRDLCSRRPAPARIQMALTVVALSLAVAAAGCSGHGGSDTPAQTTTGSAATATATRSPVSPVDVVRAAVTAAQKSYYDAYRAAAAAPSDQSLVAAVTSLYTGSTTSEENVRGRMAYFAQHGYVVRPDPGSYYVIESIEVSSLPPAGRAVVTWCGYDTDPVIDGVNRAPDGKEIFVNNTPGSGRTRVTWAEQPDGTWKISDVLVLDSWKGENRCPPRPAAS